MRVLAVHNYYQQRGGEDQCFEDLIHCLSTRGHQVETWTVHNDSIKSASKLRTAFQAIWNSSAFGQMLQRIESFRPDVIHVMNTFPLLSPSILAAAKSRAVPLVLEVANYRFACAGHYLLRDGKICEQCLHRTFPWPAVVHRCYRDSLAGSLSAAAIIGWHRFRSTLQRNVTRFLCPSQTAKDKLAELGIPPDRIEVKGNVLSFDPGVCKQKEDYLVFVGRLSPEKGLHTVFDAFQRDASLPALKIIGSGPMAAQVTEVSQRDSRIQWLGHLPLTELLEVVGRAKILLMPSVWHETFGRTTIEAFAKGTPVLGANIGGMSEVIDHGRTGWKFVPGDTDSFLAKLRQALQLSEPEMNEYRRAARAEFEAKYTDDANHRMLMAAYQRAIETAASVD